jgi:hypothetical protein
MQRTKTLRRKYKHNFLKCKYIGVKFCIDCGSFVGRYLRSGQHSGGEIGIERVVWAPVEGKTEKQ